MTTLTIELPDELALRVQNQGLDPEQLEPVVVRLLQLYLHQHEVRETISLFEQSFVDAGNNNNNKTTTATNQPRPRFGSGKHLNIEMSDDFDEPLEDFAEYME